MSFDLEILIDRLDHWDVIWPYDEFVIPRTWKMWVCVSKENLWFLRINTKRYNENCILLSKEKHLWLGHDRFMRCGGELISNMSKDILIEKLDKQKCPERQGILGSIDEVSRSAICAAIECSDKLTSFQKECIAKELGS